MTNPLTPTGDRLLEAEVALPAPVYTSWEDYLASTTERDRLQWCRVKSKTTNRRRHLGNREDRKITPLDVWQIAEAAQGRCTYCGSLAVEGRPSGHDGRPTSWTSVGRRIGSLEHRAPLVDGRWNDAVNLAWACLWCNTWEKDRQPGATDHGAIQERLTESADSCSTDSSDSQDVRLKCCECSTSFVVAVDPAGYAKWKAGNLYLSPDMYDGLTTTGVDRIVMGLCDECDVEEDGSSDPFVDEDR